MQQLEWRLGHTSSDVAAVFLTAECSEPSEAWLERSGLQKRLSASHSAENTPPPFLRCNSLSLGSCAFNGAKENAKYLSVISHRKLTLGQAAAAEAASL